MAIQRLWNNISGVSAPAGSRRLQPNAGQANGAGILGGLFKEFAEADNKRITDKGFRDVMGLTNAETFTEDSAGILSALGKGADLQALNSFAANKGETLNNILASEQNRELTGQQIDAGNYAANRRPIVDAQTDLATTLSNQKKQFGVDSQAGELALSQAQANANIKANNQTTVTRMLQGENAQQVLDDRAETDIISRIITGNVGSVTKDNIVNIAELHNIITNQKDPDGKPITFNANNIMTALKGYSDGTGITGKDAANALDAENQVKINAAKVKNDNTVEAVKLERSFTNLRALANTNNDGWSDSSEENSRDGIYSSLAAALQGGVPETTIVKLANQYNISSDKARWDSKGFDAAISNFLEGKGDESNTRAGAQVDGMNPEFAKLIAGKR
jgi:hypothetical protein